jgi:hypothetical protein
MISVSRLLIRLLEFGKRRRYLTGGTEDGSLEFRIELVYFLWYQLYLLWQQARRHERKLDDRPKL